ncbi:SGM_5486 family transporter-associated protein [Streptomyces sp. HUAS MG47]
MPYLEPNPPNGQKKLLLVFCTMLGIGAVIAVIATIASPS